jgi:ABC-type bacteriocin/lantibiotic exporters, contain an N-terminal double-glycine peptidase domain
MYCIDAVIVFIGMIGTIIVYGTAYNKGISVESFMVFNTVYGQINGAVATVTGMIGVIIKIVPSLRQLKPILSAQTETQDDKPSIKKTGGGVELCNVSFRYSEDLPWVINNLSLKIHAGEYVGIVGRSGCGKSTLIRILMGFETPQMGSVMYGEYDLSDVNVRSLRSKLLAVVLQDARLLRGDLFHNITLSAPNATLEDAWEAAEIAGIADDIRKLPMGMNTFVSEGSGGISGGQRQRIIIARAVCSRRKILIMDEATSALDNITQKVVADSLDKLKCTRIVVAHRLSTIRNCDRILVLDNGSVAESGTYEELIDRNGIFAELVERQRLDGE